MKRAVVRRLALSAGLGTVAAAVFCAAVLAFLDTSLAQELNLNFS